MRANAVFPADLQSYGPNGSEFHKNCMSCVIPRVTMNSSIPNQCQDPIDCHDQASSILIWLRLETLKKWFLSPWCLIVKELMPFTGHALPW